MLRGVFNRFQCVLLALCSFAAATGTARAEVTLKPDGYHVQPGDRIQDALDKAAANPTNKVVKVHAGIYRPDSKRQALIWFNRKHDGVQLEAVGEVTLTAENTALSDPKSSSHPAVVNHVVYFGDGLSPKTLMRGFIIKGANGFMTREGTEVIEPDTQISKGLFFFSDGGGIKVFGRSYPRIIGVTVADNYATPCAGGISIQHEGHGTNMVQLIDCVFRNNRAQVTGSAIDLLEGSTAKVVNCLFVANASNLGQDTISTKSGQPPFTNNGVVTVFQSSRIWMERCTLTGNRNGVEDFEGQSVFRNCIFWDNHLKAGQSGGKPFDLDVQTGTRVEGSFVQGTMPNPYNGQFQTGVVTNPPPPKFDLNFVPSAPAYGRAGYRPAK